MQDNVLSFKIRSDQGSSTEIVVAVVLDSDIKLHSEKVLTSIKVKNYYFQNFFVQCQCA